MTLELGERRGGGEDAEEHVTPGGRADGRPREGRDQHGEQRADRQGDPQHRGHLVAYLERLQDAGRLDPEADPVAVAQATFGTIPGFVLQRLVIGDVSSGTCAAGWAALTGAPWPPGSSVEG
ncbi:hypothetical protein BJF80_05120 [Serinicoccus sp. CUA-874]|uniref:hypothetical protein n=1 Tax=Serinicoccus sp. CUA-874 TaxID=1517939 RepID=UPI0009687D1B|nr:hypothetical protein [Serinicoccus sp. CUA-874]OLT16715.1 hypothetical protein BJF80_05120 [Serinicoccus sp. CUA-874]